MILRRWEHFLSISLLFLLIPSMVNLEETGPVYDTGDWIPINPTNQHSITRESKSNDRILNVGESGEKFLNDDIHEKPLVYRKPLVRKVPKRSPAQRITRPKIEEPYRFESVPIKHHHHHKNHRGVVPQYQPQYFIPQAGQFIEPQYYQPNIPHKLPQQYTTIPLEFQNLPPQISLGNQTSFQNPENGVVSSEYFDSTSKPQFSNHKLQIDDDKESVQLLYVPLDQLQKPHSPGILDDAFKSLQQQKFVAQAPQALPLVSQEPTTTIPHKSEYQLQEDIQKTYELISKNRGELILQTPQKSVQVSNTQQVNVQQQKIVEVPQKDSQVQQTISQFTPRDPQGYFIQRLPNNLPEQSQQQPRQYYTVRNPYFQQEAPVQKGSRLESIQRDILQQTLEVEKLQKQIKDQEGKSLEFQTKPQTTPKKRKPHQPPLSVYMNQGNNQGDVKSVLNLLKSAETIAVQDHVGPNSPNVFIGPSNLNTPEGFSKFPLPYLSSLDSNRIQRKAQQLPFFVAPLNYKEPEGYSKIPLPSPHIGSVVISRFNPRPSYNNQLESFSTSPRPINNYKYVNPVIENNPNSNFDNVLNSYSLENSPPRQNPNKLYREQGLYQQINGFSEFDLLPQYHQQIHPNPVLTTPDQPTQEFTRPRVETSSRGTKKGNSILTPTTTEESEKRFVSPASRYQEINPEKVAQSTQTPLTQEYFSRFAFSSTPNYETPTAASQEVPANIRKLPEDETVIDNNSRLEELLDELENRKPQQQQQTQPTENTKQEYEQQQFQYPQQLGNVNQQQLLGLINELQDQNQPPTTTFRYETHPVVTTIIPTTTETSPPQTTTRRIRGRGRSRFHMTSTTPSSYNSRRHPERRRPAPSTKSEDTEKQRPRTRLQNSLSERVSESSVEATSPLPTRTMEITQNQPNYYVEYQGVIGNEQPVIRQEEEEPKSEEVPRFVEQYQSQKVTPGNYNEEISQRQNNFQSSTTTTEKPETEKPPRRRVRVRGRPKNKYSSTTIAPRTTTHQEDHTEYYGFIRQPSYSQSSQINNNNNNEQEENLHLYAPIQQKTSPVFVHENYEITSSPRIDVGETTTPVRFVGELRTKYLSPSRGTTSSPDESTTQRVRPRSRVRIPGRNYNNENKQQQSTEKPRGRARGRSHFTSPRTTREDTNETENYPVSYLRSRTENSKNDQIPYSTMNHAEKFKNNDIEVMSFRDERMKQEGFKVVNVDQFDTAESQDYRNLLNSLISPMKVNELKSKEMDEDVATTTETTFFNQTESLEVTTTSSNLEEVELTTQSDEASTETLKLTEQTALDLLALQTSTSTEISHETEICYKGRCIKSRDKKLKKQES